jgi:hypothetical protein
MIVGKAVLQTAFSLREEECWSGKTKKTELIEC